MTQAAERIHQEELATRTTPLEHLLVLTDAEGRTQVHIPAPQFWQCVDCLGANRLEAAFTFTPPYFVARFRVATASRVREALRVWSMRDPADG